MYVIPAKAGIHVGTAAKMDPRLRGDDVSQQQNASPQKALDSVTFMP